MDTSLGINLSDYNAAGQAGGFAGGNMEDINNLTKALDAGQITGRETTDLTTASGAPLKVESLEKTLKHLTFNENDIVLWKNVPKKAAFNTVEEYNQLTSYGQDRGGFNNEGELPVEEDSQYIRRAQLVKYLGVTKSVSHQMQLVNTMVGNIIERETKNGTMWILRKLNKSLYFGDSALVPQEFNGFIAQHQRSDAWTSLNDYYGSTSIVDARGASLTEAMIETGANNIVENFGVASQLYAPPSVISNFVKNFYGNKFIQPNSPALTNGVMGQVVNTFASQFGNIGLNWDIFFKKLPTKLNTAIATSTNAPAAPTISAVAAVGSDASSKWIAADAGTYFYAVTGINRFGESTLAITAAGTAVVTGGALDLTFAGTSSTYPATAFRIYRSNKGAASAAVATFYPLFDISLAELTAGFDGGAAGVARDRNRLLPNCDQAFLLQMNNEVIEFAQLAPLMKMDLAIISPAYRFMLLMYGTPFLYAIRKMVRIINIGA